MKFWNTMHLKRMIVLISNDLPRGTARGALSHTGHMPLNWKE